MRRGILKRKKRRGENLVSSSTLPFSEKKKHMFNAQKKGEREKNKRQRGNEMKKKKQRFRSGQSEHKRNGGRDWREEKHRA